MHGVPSRQTARRTGTAVAAAGLAALALSACDTDGYATSARQAVTAQTITAPVAPVASTTPVAPGKFDGSVGDCVSLSGVVSAPVIARAECGSMESNFKVIDVAANHNQCIADADMWYANTLNGSEIQAYCLDVDWVTGDCLTVAGDWPIRVDCAAIPPTTTVWVRSIQPDTVDGSICGSPDSAVVYTERRIVVCLDPA
ncbi:MAG TPA: hypothetical protein VIW24_08125 [Aldersonia sp.]